MFNFDKKVTHMPVDGGSVVGCGADSPRREIAPPQVAVRVKNNSVGGSLQAQGYTGVEGWGL